MIHYHSYCLLAYLFIDSSEERIRTITANHLYHTLLILENMSCYVLFIYLYMDAEFSFKTRKCAFKKNVKPRMLKYKRMRCFAL